MGEAFLRISEKISEGICIISAAGDIDAHTSPAFKETIDKNILSGSLRIVFDFSGLNYISSAGIGVLNAALYAVKGRGGKMSIFGVSKTVYDTLDLMYFTRKIPVKTDLASAIVEVNG